MTAVADLSAALLPPEHGGPDPERVAALLDRHLRNGPPGARLGVRALARAVGTAASVAGRGRWRSLDAEGRAEALAAVAHSRPEAALAIDALKGLVLLISGADAFADQIHVRATRFAPARPDPPLAIVDARDQPSWSRADVVVIGSGAGGAMAALRLAQAGLDVVIVEEGRRWRVEEFRNSHPLHRFGNLYRDAGATAALGTPSIVLPLGRAVGGTTVINSGTCYRPPAAVVDRWHLEHGLELAEPGALGERAEEVERRLEIAPAPIEVIGRNAELALAGAAALGWDAAPLRRNAPGCAGSCQCAIGCPRNAKLGVHLSALPAACEAGARIVQRLRVDRILHEGGRATGIAARRPDGSRVRIEAGRVVVAAGATETPPLLRRSGLGAHPRTGRGLALHPAISAAGRFSEPVVAWEGVMQSVGIEELHERDGVLIEATSTPPGMGSMLLPGYGRRLLEEIAAADHLGTLGAMVADAPAGRVDPLPGGRSLVRYRLTRRDGERLVRALEAMGRVLFAAGAEEVLLGIPGAPAARDERELADLVAGADPRTLHLAAFHPSGTAAAGSDPERHPVDPEGRLRGAENVWVSDASILPSSPTVNPQISIMSLALGVGGNAAA